MSRTDYGFYFFEEKKEKEIYVRLSWCILFFTTARWLAANHSRHRLTGSVSNTSPSALCPAHRYLTPGPRCPCVFAPGRSYRLFSFTLFFLFFFIFLFFFFLT